MKPWEIEKTNKKMKRLSGEATLRIFFDLYQAGYKILRESILAEKPNLSPKKLKLEIKKLVEAANKL